MSIMEDTETKSTPKKKRKTAKKKRAATPPTPKADGIYAGLTVQDCCNACNKDGCVISGRFYCAHPRKGGLHSNEQQDNDALRRRRDAERFLGKQKLVVE